MQKQKIVHSYAKVTRTCAAPAAVCFAASSAPTFRRRVAGVALSLCSRSRLPCPPACTPLPKTPQNTQHNNSEANKAPSACAKFLGTAPRTFLFVADPGTFSGTPENVLYLSACAHVAALASVSGASSVSGARHLTQPHQQTPSPIHHTNNSKENLVGNTPFPKGATSCPDARYGKIMGQPVAVVTTGIGPMASALCVYDIMEACGSTVKEIIYSGTSGWTPQLGGILNNGSCSAANSVGRINRVGDVCVSPFSVNWDCRQASWSQTAAEYPNVCSFPEQLFGPSASFLFGTCEFPNVTATQLALSDEIIAAATRPGARSEMPAPSARIISNDAAYWTAMEAGTGVAYPPYNTSGEFWRERERCVVEERKGECCFFKGDCALCEECAALLTPHPAQTQTRHSIISAAVRQRLHRVRRDRQPVLLERRVVGHGGAQVSVVCTTTKSGALFDDVRCAPKH